MPTVVDSLVILLGLDSKDVDNKAPGVKKQLSDLEKSAGKTESGVKGIGKAAKGTGEELTALAGKMASFLALIGGAVALRQFAAEAIRTNTQLGYLSKNLDIPVQSLSAWGIAATMVGGSAQEMQGYLSHLTTESANLSNGLGSSLIPILGKMGVAMIDSKGKARSAIDELKDMAKWAQGKNREQVYAWFQQAGMPAGVANLLLQNPAKFAAMLTQAGKYTVTDKEASSAAQMTMQLALLRAQFLKLGYDILEKVTPFLEKVFAVLTRGLDWCLAHQTAVASFFAALAAGIGVVTIAAGAFLLSTIEISGPILLVVAAVAALSAAFTALASDYSTWSQGGASTFDWSGFESNIRKAGEAFKWLGDQISEATDRFENWLRAHGIAVPEGAVKKGLKWWWNHATLPGVAGLKINEVPDVTRALGQGIAKEEGFFAEGETPNIPQQAHNPGDIEYGEFAIAHGATGSVTAAGGQQIATFPDVGTGWNALYALLGTKGYAGLTAHQAAQRWGGVNASPGYASEVLKQSGLPSDAVLPSSSSVTDGTKETLKPAETTTGASSWFKGMLKSAEKLMKGVSGSSAMLSAPLSNGRPQLASVDRSVTTHVGRIEINTQATNAKGIWDDMQRSMDSLTMSPANTGLLT